jgi:hypothetical protein
MGSRISNVQVEKSRSGHIIQMNRKIVITLFSKHLMALLNSKVGLKLQDWKKTQPRAGLFMPGLPKIAR